MGSRKVHLIHKLYGKKMKSQETGKQQLTLTRPSLHARHSSNLLTHMILLSEGEPAEEKGKTYHWWDAEMRGILS